MNELSNGINNTARVQSWIPGSIPGEFCWVRLDQELIMKELQILRQV